MEVMNIAKWVCESCIYDPPSSTDGKPCTKCNPDDPFWSCYSEKLSDNDLSQMDIVYFVKDEPSNEELRYSLRSVEKNFPHRNVWFYGGCPDDLQPDRWAHIKQNARSKWGNTSGLLRNACANEGISENFVLFNDDFFVLKTALESMPPTYYGDIDFIVEKTERGFGKPIVWTTRLKHLKKTLLKSGKGTLNYAVHKPMLVNRKKLKALPFTTTR